MKRPILTLSRFVVLLIVSSCFFYGCKSSESLEYEYVEFAYAESKSYAIQQAIGEVEDVHIPSEHNGYPVTHILDGVFYGYNMKSLIMNSVTTIYQEAFAQCSYLSELDLGVVEIIGQQAFRGCRSLKSVTIPETVLRIESGAFIDCTELEFVYFEGAPEEFGSGVFDPDVIIYGSLGSTVEEYAKSNGFKFFTNEDILN